MNQENTSLAIKAGTRNKIAAFVALTIDKNSLSPTLKTKHYKEFYPKKQRIREYQNIL
ncbi:MAG TPA: hypothetical protein VLG71_01630 [Candidatus Limnocylindria bacterium]|nr:hypothetical protein [Candidatus Limnocylindria bacterium]